MADVLRFLGWDGAVVLRMDYSAARGAAARLGVGKMRSLDIRALWLQQAVSDGRVRVEAVCGLKNVSDIGTKVLTRDRLMLLAMKAGTMNCEVLASPAGV